MKQLLKKLLDIKVIALLSAVLAMSAALTVGNISAFLGWLTVTFYSIREVFPEKF